jgi:hypothetical protein
MMSDVRTDRCGYECERVATGWPHQLLVSRAGRRILSCTIPEQHDTLVSLKTEHADRGGTKHQWLSGCNRPAEPACGQDAQKMSMGEQGDGSFQLRHPGNDLVSTRHNVLGFFAARAAMEKNIPVRPRAMDLILGFPFKFPVIPFLNQWLVKSARESGMLRSLPRATRGTGKYVIETDIAQAFAQFLRLSNASRCERNFRPPRMLLRNRPRRFTMADQVQDRTHQCTEPVGPALFPSTVDWRITCLAQIPWRFPPCPN